MKMELDGELAVLTLDHGRANAMGPAFLKAFDDLFAQATRSPARAIVLTGAGRSFSAGLDLPNLIGLDRATMRSFITAFEESMLRVFQEGRPVVAALNGHAIAGGCVLALQADLRIMAEGTARMGLNEVALGIGLPAEVLLSARAQLPPASLVPVCLEGRLFGPAEARAVGLVDEVVAPEAVLPRALERARALAQGGQQAVAQVKRALRRPVLEAVAASRAGETEAWLDTWFGTEARQRLQATVDRLTR
jgi:enoyl-CoA hydratase